MDLKARQAALDAAIHSARMSDRRPTEAGLKIMQAWARGEITDEEADAAIDLAHRQANETAGESSGD